MYNLRQLFRYRILDCLKEYFKDKYARFLKMKTCLSLENQWSKAEVKEVK